MADKSIAGLIAESLTKGGLVGLTLGTGAALIEDEKIRDALTHPYVLVAGSFYALATFVELYRKNRE